MYHPWTFTANYEITTKLISWRYMRIMVGSNVIIEEYKFLWPWPVAAKTFCSKISGVPTRGLLFMIFCGLNASFRWSATKISWLSWLILITMRSYFTRFESSHLVLSSPRRSCSWWLFRSFHIMIQRNLLFQSSKSCLTPQYRTGVARKEHKL